MRYLTPLTVLLFPLVFTACSRHRGPSTDYSVYGGNKQNNRFSALDQINLANVKDLQPAWIYNSADTADPSKRRRSRDLMIQCQPIVVDGVLYGISPTLKLFAVNAATGQEIWKFDPFKYAAPRYNQCRGITYWTDGKDRRLFFAAGPTLYCIDAGNGTLVPTFA